MANRASALQGHYQIGKFGISDASPVTLQEVSDLVLCQVACWPDSLDSVADTVATMVGVDVAPGPGQAASGAVATALRIEPLKWLIFAADASEIDAEQGATLDVSHSRTHIRVTGESAVLLLNRLLPLDLREQSFPVGSVASSVMHHVGVLLWRSEKGYELFIPRGFALASWEVLVETAQQFDAEIV